MRCEYSGAAHGLSLFPVIQQVVGLVTILSSTTRAVAHVAQLTFRKITSSPHEDISRKLKADKEGVHLGILRFIPGVGTVVSFIILTKMDRSERGELFPELAR